MTNSSLPTLNAYLAHQGVASRRKAAELIKRGQVKVNGNMVADPGTRIHPSDQIGVEGQAVISSEKKRYIVLNKPAGILSTVIDTHERTTLMDLVKVNERVYPVGRLDKDSTGLILLTNDGELAYQLTHPKFHIPKTYAVTILGRVGETSMSRLRKGVELEDGWTAPAEVQLKTPPDKGDGLKAQGVSLLQITLYEGKKRQIRRMCSALHLHILELKRVAIGLVKLGNLVEGQWRDLTPEEVKSLNPYRKV